MDLNAIREDVEMAHRSPEMARHVALDHGPELIAEVERLKARLDAVEKLDALYELFAEAFPPVDSRDVIRAYRRALRGEQ